MNLKFTNDHLIQIAKDYQKNSTANYSHFKVGAALLDKDGTIYGGCNVESSSYGLTICAERVALTKAISEGARDFTKIAIVGPNNEFCSPCGACRQLLHDYAPDLKFILTDNTEIKSINLRDLLPFAFEEKNLKTI
jgi:cytidine deaminase